MESSNWLSEEPRSNLFIDFIGCQPALESCVWFCTFIDPPAADINYPYQDTSAGKDKYSTLIPFDHIRKIHPKPELD